MSPSGAVQAGRDYSDCRGAGRRIDPCVEGECEGHSEQTSHAQELNRTAGSPLPREDIGTVA